MAIEAEDNLSKDAKATIGASMINNAYQVMSDEEKSGAVGAVIQFILKLDCPSLGNSPTHSLEEYWQQYR